MKKMILIMIAITISYVCYSQRKISIGGGLTYKPGAVIEFELEKQLSESFSIPFRSDIGYFLTDDYNSFTIDIHKGYRKSFQSGFLIEQSMGIGGTASYYKVESIWYEDNYGNVIRFKDGANWSIMPSVTLGTGYKIGKKSDASNLIWIRGKIYWNLGFSGLNLPHAMVQIGYSFNIKK